MEASVTLGSVRLGRSLSAVHSSPLSPEYFASALISLEIKFSSVLLNVKMFFLRIYSTMTEILIFKILNSLILPHLLYPQPIQSLCLRELCKMCYPLLRLIV